MKEEKSIFVEVFGDYPLVRVLDLLLTFREFDYPLTEIAENAGVGWTTLHIFWPKLEKMGIVKQTRTIGRAKLYKLNTENPVVKELIKFDNKICSYYADKIIEKQTIKAA